MSAKKKKQERYNVGKEKKIGEIQCRQIFFKGYKGEGSNINSACLKIGEVQCRQRKKIEVQCRQRKKNRRGTMSAKK